MKENGFTLVEVIGVITILAVITLVTVPAVTGMLKKQQENEYQSFLNDVFLATEAYLQNNLKTYTENEEYSFENEGDYVYIYLADLMRQRFLNSNTYNPKKKELVKAEKDYTVVVTLQSDLTYHFELREEKLTRTS